MITKVFLKKNQLDYFRAKARASKFEIHAYLVGKESYDGTSITIEKFIYPKNYEIQSAYNVKWFLEDKMNLIATIDNDSTIVGDIHTHPNAEAILSNADYYGSLAEELLVCGICSVYGNKTFVRFWNPECALPMEIEYE